MIENPNHDACDETLTCFAIWEHGRSKEAEIIEDLAKHFEILGTFHIHWSDEHYNRNLSRLYESAEPTEVFYKYSKKVGKPPFTFIIVRDNKPVYTYLKTVSGAIEAVNKNVIARKREYRDWFDKPYQIHSSCNFNEFSSQAAMILGMKTLEATLRGDNKEHVIEIKKDLEGATGWRNWDELLSILNYASDYLILRDFDDLLDRAPEETLELLCNGYQSLASIANIHQDLARPYTGKMMVSNQPVNINLRFVGDGYYATSWAKDMIDNRVYGHGFYTPNTEDLFFSLLYHTKAHRKDLNENYANMLKTLAENLSYDWFLSDMIVHDQDAGAILSGYMRAQKYYYEQPVDRSVNVNLSVVKLLPKLKDIGMSIGKQRKQQWKRTIRALKRTIKMCVKKTK